MANNPLALWRFFRWRHLSAFLVLVLGFSPLLALASSVSCEQSPVTRSIWWRQTDKLLDAFYDVQLSRGLPADAALASVRQWGSQYPKLPDHTATALARHLAIKLQFLDQLIQAQQHVDADTSACLIRAGWVMYQREGTPLALTAVENTPLTGQWEWALGPQRKIVERYEFRPDGTRLTQTGEVTIRSVVSLFRIGAPEAQRWLLLSTGIGRTAGKGPFQDNTVEEGEITVRSFIRFLDPNTYQTCEKSDETVCYGLTTRISRP